MTRAHLHIGAQKWIVFGPVGWLRNLWNWLMGMFRTRIGLEIHAQLKSKYSLVPLPDSVPNTCINEFDLGFPGTLPKLNNECLRLALTAALSLNCQISDTLTFDHPFATNGYLTLDKYDGLKDSFRASIQHIQLEQDTGKTLGSGTNKLIDYNRSGVGLIEIVTEPIFTDGKSAVSFLKKLNLLLKSIDVCEGDMENGSFRCDLNISVSDPSRSLFGSRCEVKNVNSFRSCSHSIELEVERQQNLLSSGIDFPQETMRYDPHERKLFTMRSKEDSNEYRFLSGPDIPPMPIPKDLVNEIKNNLPKTIDYTRKVLSQRHSLGTVLTTKLSGHSPSFTLFTTILQKVPMDTRFLADWITSEIWGQMTRYDVPLDNILDFQTQIIDILGLFSASRISGKSVKALLTAALHGETDIHKFVDSKGMFLDTDYEKAVEQKCREVFENSPQQADRLKRGEKRALGYFVGSVIPEFKSKVDPKFISDCFMRLAGK